MSDCCDGSSCDARPPAQAATTCPECGKKGKSVSLLTVKSLVRAHGRVLVGTYFYCRTPDCAVVYFSDAALFHKADLKVRVGLKESEDPVPLCYCFDYSRADVRDEVETKGSTDILERIKAEVKAGYCACEVKNPSGDCCLGDITRAIQQAKRLVTLPAEAVQRAAVYGH